MKHIECPIDVNTRLWMENAFIWLVGQFGKQKLIASKILLPTTEFFSYDPTDEEEVVLKKVAKVVANQMEIDLNNVIVDTYDLNLRHNLGDKGFSIYPQIESNENISSGEYFGRTDDGKYHVYIERQNFSDLESLIATLAHEFSHIKLMGEGRLEFNDEMLTDLTTVFFGLGIFNANMAFKEIKTFDGRVTRSLGYFRQREWGYALALYSYYKNEYSPNWTKYLNLNIQKDYRNSENYILHNREKVFNEIYHNPNQG